MYPPPRPATPRHGMPAGGVVLLAVACSLVFGSAGCAVGYALATPAGTESARAGASTSPAAAPSSSPRTTKPKGDTIGDGTWRVPDDIRPGTYRAARFDLCYWKRLRGFSGRTGDVIAYEAVSDGAAVATIKASDAGFSSTGCGTWTRIGN